MKRILTVVTVLFLSGQATASCFHPPQVFDDCEWTKTFTLASGTEVTHTPSTLIVRDGVKETSFVAQWFNTKGGSIFKSVPSEDGMISIDMSYETFKRELTKVAEIIEVK